MGFPAPACKRAAALTHGRGMEAATQWIMEHMDDPDFLAPLTATAPGMKSHNSQLKFSNGFNLFFLNIAQDRSNPMKMVSACSNLWALLDRSASKPCKTRTTTWSEQPTGSFLIRMKSTASTTHLPSLPQRQQLLLSQPFLMDLLVSWVFKK